MKSKMLVTVRPLASAAWHRRATVAPLVGIATPVLVGFVALTVDVGVMYNARAELQRAADAAAMAAAAELGGGAGDMSDRVLAAANAYATVNTVFGEPTTVDASDLTYGQAFINEDTGRYVFTPTTTLPNAVRVRLRRTAGSPSGPVPLFFARIFGIDSADITATAAAALTPRDICFVLDVSGSHNDDSSLRSFRKTEVPIKGVWGSLWDPAQGSPPTPGDGPSFGNMHSWGTQTVDPSWGFSADAGLVRIPKGNNSSLTGSFVSHTLSAKGYGSYTSAELNVINTGPSGESTTSYRRRVRVALGLDRWKSGKSGGQPGGDGDNTIDSNEVVSMVPYPSTPSNAAQSKSKVVGGGWDDYVDYVIDTNSSMNRYYPDHYEFGDPGLRYRYGLKTYTDYLQSDQYGNDRSPGLGGAPEQPMKSVSDAVAAALDIIEELQSNDLVGLAAYDKYGYGPAQKPANLSWLTDDLDSLRAKLANLQAGMWQSTTNTAQGLDRGAEVVFESASERRAAAKVIILLTDGRPNQTRDNPTQYYDEWLDYAHSPPRQDAVAAAQDAASGDMDDLLHRRVRIYTVSVGATCDLDLMQQIATIGHGETFHAEGDVSTYEQQLRDILRRLGGIRPVVLIE